MPTVISFLIQKGGCSKSTSCGISAYLLAQQGFKVLAVDMDSQGNLTELITNNVIGQFRNSTVLEAIKEQDAAPYVRRVTDNLHILPADALMASFPRWIYWEWLRKQPEGTNPSYLLQNTLGTVAEDYDYILIDTPPALGDQTVNALVTSDYVVMMFEPSRFCYAAVPECFETIELVQTSLNPELKVAGILRNLTDPRRKDVQSYNELMGNEYPELIFNTIIPRRAATGRVAIEGMNEQNPELNEALAPYKPFVKELIARCPSSIATS